MNAKTPNLDEASSTPTSLAYPGRYQVNDGPRAWVIFGIVLLVVTVAAFALSVRTTPVRSSTPTPVEHSRAGR